MKKHIKPVNGTPPKRSTHIIAPPNRGVAAVEVVLAPNLSAGPGALSEVDEVVPERLQVRLGCNRQGVRSEVEDVALGVGVWGVLLHRRNVGLSNLWPDVVGEVGVDVADDFVGAARNLDLVVGGTWDVEFPGRVDNCVHGHLAVRIRGKKGIIVVEDGSVVGYNLI